MRERRNLDRWGFECFENVGNENVGFLRRNVNFPKATQRSLSSLSLSLSLSLFGFFSFGGANSLTFATPFLKVYTLERRDDDYIRQTRRAAAVKLITLLKDQ